MPRGKQSIWRWVVSPGALLCVGLIIAAVSFSLALSPNVGGGYDDAHYIVLAKALAQGNGFSQILVPGAPPEVQYPPGFPLILSIVWLINPNFPANAIAFKAISAILTLGVAILVYVWMNSQGEGKWSSVVVALFTLFNPLIFGYAVSAFSEMTYTFFALAGLWAIERYAASSNEGWKEALIPSLFAAMAFYLRTFGLVLVAAGILYLVYSKQKRKAVTFGVLSALWVGPWFLRSLLLSSTGPNYWQQFWMRSMEQPELGSIGILDLVVRIVLNLRAYLLAGLPGAILPSQVPLTFVNLPEGLAVGFPFAGSDLVLAVLVAGGVLGQIILRRGLVDWYVGLYLALGLLWPWEPTRFSVPIIPFLYPYVLFELRLLATAVTRGFPTLRKLAPIPFGMGLVFIAVNALTQVSFAQAQSSQPAALDEVARGRVYEWIRENTTPTDVLAAMNDYQLYLYTGRSVIRLIGTEEERVRKQARYVVLIPYGGVMTDGDLTRIRYEAVYAQKQDDLKSVYSDPLAGIQVMRVHGGLSQ